LDIPRNTLPSRRPYVIGGLAIAGTLAGTVAVTRIGPAVPTIDRATAWIDTVHQGEMVRLVHGPGTLEPEQILLIGAVTGGRVDRIYARSGTTVTAGTPLVQMSNPDVELEALSAEQQLDEARAQLAALRTTLVTQRLTQQSALATARADYHAAKRDFAAKEPLGTQGLVSAKEIEDARDKAEQSEIAYRTATEQMTVSTESAASQIALQQETVNRLKTIAEFRRERVRSMRVLATADGVLQRLELQPGEWVQAGALLAKVIQPGQLKAVLRVPETQAKDIQLGQSASIDTRNGIIPGRVARIDPSVQNGSVTIEVALEGELPRGARPQLTVDGTVEIDRLKHALYVGRPAVGEPGSTVKLFKLSSDGTEASRVSVTLGRTSVSTIEVVRGLHAGDRVIVSDLPAAEGYDRVRLR